MTNKEKKRLQTVINDKENEMARDDHRGFQKEYYPRSGHIAVMMGFITTEQLKVAINEQIDDDLANRPHRYIGEILFQRGWISEDQIEIILDELKKEEMKHNGE